MASGSYSKEVVIGPDVGFAIAELRLAYAWLIAPVKAGGLGYSKAKAQKSHIHRALEALGGA